MAAATTEILHLHPGASPDDWAHFDMVLGLTADLLPVVSNPRATIAPESTLKDLGKTPSRYNGAHQAVGLAKWTERITTPADIATWSRDRDLGICIQTRRVRAFDVDVTDPALASQIHAHLAHLGLPVRSRANASKFLLAFELAGDFQKRRVKCTTEKNGPMIEFLATGQQFIAAGLHPSGVRYEWAGGLPDAFPVLTAEQFEAVWAELVATFGAEPASESQASVKHQKLADVAANDPVAQFLLNAGRVKRTERDGRLHITCPFEDEHTGDSGETSTTYWPAHTGGYANGHFHCLHAHCEHRVDQDFLDAAGYVDEDLLSEFSAIADAGIPASGDDPVPIKADVTIDTAAAPKPPRFQVLPAATFAAGKPQVWLVKGVLPKAQLGVLFGESGAGKTFAATDLAVDIALGTSWRGLRTTKARVIYIAAEGASGFRLRLRAVCLQRGIELADLPIGVIADAPNMMEKQDALDVAKSIVAAGGADLIMVDTWAQVTPGANENSGEDMGKALAHCRGLNTATGAMVVLVHHSGKDASRGSRGWSGLKGAADVQLEVVRVEDKRSLSVEKMKDGEDGAEYAFRLQSVVLGLDADGDEITSCVVEHSDGAVRRSRDRGPKGAVEKMVLSTLEDLAGVGADAVTHAALKDAVKAQMTHDEGTRDTRGQRIERALESLIGAKHLVRDGVALRLGGAV